MAKKSVTYKIDPIVLVDFNNKAKSNAINKSQWIEIKMKEYLKEVRK